MEKQLVESIRILASYLDKNRPMDIPLKSIDSMVNDVDMAELNLEKVEERTIRLAIMTCPTLSGAAEALGINLSTLWRKRQKYKT